MNIVQGGNGGLGLRQSLETNPSAALGAAGVGVAHDLDLDQSSERLEDWTKHFLGADGRNLANEKFSFLSIDG